jgi:hypothetical protein
VGEKKNVHSGIDMSLIFVEATSVDNNIDPITAVGNDGVVDDATVGVGEQRVRGGVLAESSEISSNELLKELNAVLTINAVGRTARSEISVSRDWCFRADEGENARTESVPCEKHQTRMPSHGSASGTGGYRPRTGEAYPIQRIQSSWHRA